MDLLERKWRKGERKCGSFERFMQGMELEVGVLVVFGNFGVFFWDVHGGGGGNGGKGHDVGRAVGG